MNGERPEQSDSDAGLILEIVETLEDRGIDRCEYRLYDVIDPDSLEQLIRSASNDIEVRVTVQGVQLSVTGDGVTTAGDESP